MKTSPPTHLVFLNITLDAPPFLHAFTRKNIPISAYSPLPNPINPVNPVNPVNSLLPLSPPRSCVSWSPTLPIRVHSCPFVVTPSPIPSFPLFPSFLSILSLISFSATLPPPPRQLSPYKPFPHPLSNTTGLTNRLQKISAMIRRTHHRLLIHIRQSPTPVVPMRPIKTI